MIRVATTLDSATTTLSLQETPVSRIALKTFSKLKAVCSYLRKKFKQTETSRQHPSKTLTRAVSTQIGLNSLTLNSSSTSLNRQGPISSLMFSNRWTKGTIRTTGKYSILQATQPRKICHSPSITTRVLHSICLRKESQLEV